MKIGITLPQVGPQATRENVIELAKMAEQERLDSLWVGERLLWPIKPKTRYPATSDGSIPTDYQNVFDPIETLAFVAATTDKIALGTAVIDMLFHNPVVLGRRFATLDVLSEGRVIAGLGLGYSKDEFQVSNIPYENRGARADEFIEALKKIWTDDVVEFKGKYYNIPASKIGPKPIQKPHIPIYLGGFSPNTFARITKYANGWLGAVGGPLEYLDNSVRNLRGQAAKANKDPNKFRIILRTSPQITNSSKPNGQRFPMSGTIDEVAGDLRRIKEMGVDHLIFGFTGLNLTGVIDTAKEFSKYVN
ncbi:MAG: TIGR03619 family F420-dependent LLM class oxidoreductase [Thermoproteota archaeon]|nr:TIGR03619 family F420-dependent LLM class oxidoreductase [Thermoproteota archaeon]